MFFTPARQGRLEFQGLLERSDSPAVTIGILHIFTHIGCKKCEINNLETLNSICNVKLSVLDVTRM